MASGMILVEEGTEEHTTVKNIMLSGMDVYAINTTIVSIHKFSPDDETKKAKYEAFQLFTKDMANKNGGDANVQLGFYAGSKELLKTIFSGGFNQRDLRRSEYDEDSHGIGIHLVPPKFSHLAAEETVPDEEGDLRHLLMCNIILGKSELICSGSKQLSPSSTEFHSAVDDLNDPTTYVIWSSDMNTHIFPWTGRF